MSELRTEQHGAVLVLTIDREHAYNALNSSVIGSLSSAVVAAAADPTLRAVIITGAGAKAFCAGADLRELEGISSDDAHRALKAGQDAFRAIELSEIPVIAAVNGLALGGGFELILASTFAVLSTNATMGLPESSLGLIPGYGGTQRLPRAVGSATAAHLMLTGARLSAARAYQLGLSPVEPVAPEILLETALEIADRIAAQGPESVRSILQCVGLSVDTPLDAGLGLETGLAAIAAAGEEAREGISAFFEKRTAVFTRSVDHNHGEK